jgi:hypothetical protein
MKLRLDISAEVRAQLDRVLDPERMRAEVDRAVAAHGDLREPRVPLETSR